MAENPELLIFMANHRDKMILSDYQKKLFPYAYNILGSSDDALDAVQDVIVRHLSLPEKKLENEWGYLVKSVINQAINTKKRNQKITNGKVWLPEPVATEYADANIRQNEIISYSMLVLLEYLNPKERAVFILKEAFDYSHEDIAETLNMTVENSRKLLSRAKTALKTDENFKSSVSPAENSLQDYMLAIRSGNVQQLEALLSEAITVKTDGGKISIVSPIEMGLKAVSGLMLYVYKAYQESLDVQIGKVNHQPALLFFDNGQLSNCQIFEFGTDGKISHIFSVVDPEKLKKIHLF